MEHENTFQLLNGRGGLEATSWSVNEEIMHGTNLILSPTGRSHRYSVLIYYS